MTHLAHPSAQPAPAPLCRYQILGLLLEGAGLSEIRIEALIDRLTRVDAAPAMTPGLRP